MSTTALIVSLVSIAINMPLMVFKVRYILTHRREKRLKNNVLQGEMMNNAQTG